MLFFTRTMLPAIALAAMLSTAQAQTATGSEHEGHHPEGAAPAAQSQAAPAPTPGTQPGMNMGGMMGGGMMGHQGGQSGMMCGMMGQKSAQSGMMGGGMMGHQGGMGMPFEHTEGRIAFLKAELGITDAQTAQWNTVADAMRANARIHRTMHEHMTKGGMPSSWSERLTFQQKALSSRLDGLKALDAAYKPLYAVLTEDQKKLAEKLLSGPMGMM